jgi:signal peptidase I
LTFQAGTRFSDFSYGEARTLDMNAIDEKPAPANDTAEFKAEPGAGERAATDTPAEGVPPKPSIAANPGDAAKKTKLTDRESLIETVKTVAYALLIALVIRTFLFQPFNIPSGSMEATLLVGDYLFVEKFAYGYSRYSFPWGLGPIPSGRIWQGSGPQRGDVVVFKLPVDNSTDYIKRVIGLPGDRIQLINGQIYLNGKAVPRVRVADYVEDDPLGTPHGVPRYRETLPGGKSYYVLAREPDGPQNNTDVYVVPPGHYFMMGDNRDNSLDSRFAPDGLGIFQNPGGVGFVPAANLVGKAEFIFFSNDGPLWEIWTWPWTVRFSRMFTTID